VSSVPSKRWSEDVELLVLQVLFKFDALSRLPMEQWKEDAKHAVFALFHLSVALCLLKSTRPALPHPPNWCPVRWEMCNEIYVAETPQFMWACENVYRMQIDDQRLQNADKQWQSSTGEWPRLGRSVQPHSVLGQSQTSDVSALAAPAWKCLWVRRDINNLRTCAHLSIVQGSVVAVAMKSVPSISLPLAIPLFLSKVFSRRSRPSEI